MNQRDKDPTDPAKRPAEDLGTTDLPPPAEPDPEPSNLTATVVRGAGLAGLGYVLAQALTLGFFIVLARIATPTDFGEYAAGTLLVGIGMLFTESGMMAALIHRKDRIDEAASTAVVAAAVGGLGLSLVCLAAAPLVGILFDSDKTDGTTVAEIAAVGSGLLFLRSLMVVPESLLQRRFSFLRRLVIEPFGVVIFGVVAVIACSDGMGPWGLLLGYYAGAAGDVVLSWALLNWRPRLHQMSFAMWRELISYGRHILGGAALWRASDEVPIVLIGRFAGAAALGQFRFANRIISTPLSLVVQAGSYVLFPALARITESRERFRDACRRSLRIMCALAFPLTLLLLPLGMPLAVIIFGTEWREAGYAAMALAGLPVAATLVSFTSEVVKADGHPEVLPRMHATTLVVSVIAMVALLRFDLIGIVLGWSIGWLAGGVYGLRRTAQLLGVPLREYWGEILPPALAAFVMAGLLMPLEFLVVESDTHGALLGLLLIGAQALLGVAIYLALLRGFSPTTLEALREVAGRLRRRGRSAAEAEEEAQSAAAQEVRA